MSVEYHCEKLTKALKVSHHDKLSRFSREAFEHHMISMRSEGRWLLQRPHKNRWDDPKGRWDWGMAAEIICLRSNEIYVGGDISHVIFGHGPADHLARIRWMGKCKDIAYYVHQKASIGMGGKGLADAFDEDVAKDSLRDMIEQRIESLIDNGDDKYLEPLWLFFDEDIGGYDWPMDEDERDLDDPVDGPYHLREYLLRHIEDGAFHPPLPDGDGESLTKFLTEHGELDDMELLEKLKPWLAQRQADFVKAASADDPGVRAIQETIDSLCDFGSSSRIYEALQNNLGHEARVSGDKDLYHLAEERYDLGQVVAPRVYYAHAALRKLCELLDAEEEGGPDDRRNPDHA